MITDKQVGKLKKLLSKKETLARAAVKSGMDEKTARKYRDSDKLPSEIKVARNRDWKTREDQFAEVWGGVEPLLELNPGLEAKTIFEYLQRKSPGCFEDGQLRTFQRRVKNWRAKDHILCAIALELVQQGRRILFILHTVLVQNLLVAKRDLALVKALEKLAKYDALIIDDIGYVQQSREEMEVLFMFDCCRDRRALSSRKLALIGYYDGEANCYRHKKLDI